MGKLAAFLIALALVAGSALPASACDSSHRYCSKGCPASPRHHVGPAQRCNCSGSFSVCTQMFSSEIVSDDQPLSKSILLPAFIELGSLALPLMDRAQPSGHLVSRHSLLVSEPEFYILSCRFLI